MKFCFDGLSDTGMVRSVNQDNYYVDESNSRFFIVADGMGGHAGGQEASAIAINAIREYLEENWEKDEDTEKLLEEAITIANLSILKDQSLHPERGEMGTTVVMLLFRQEKTWIAHVGDSRLYRLRNQSLQQLTDDHTWVGRAIKIGDLTKEEAKKHPWRHVLSQCLGRQELYHIEIQSVESESGDRYLLCSDGLTEEVPDELIEKLLDESENPQQATEKLVSAAKELGGSDNITVVVVSTD